MGHGTPLPGVKDSGITGRLGTLDIVLATMAYTAPLTASVGYITFVIAFGNGIGAPAAFIAVTIAFVLFTVGYNALTRHVPNAGAFYAYITTGLGRETGLGSGFLILANYLAQGVGLYAFAGLSLKGFIDEHAGPDVPWYVWSLVFWVLVSSVSYFHVSVSAKILGVLLIAEMVMLAIFATAIFLQGGVDGISLEVFSWHNFTSGELGLALVFAGCLWAGFEATAIYREEARDPERTIPRATYIVVVLIGVMYVLVSWAFLSGLGYSKAVERATNDPAGAFFTVGRQFAGQLFVEVSSVLLLTSIIACCLAIQNVATRYVYSMSVDGIFPQALGQAHTKHHSPSRSSVLVSALFFGFVTILAVVGLTATQVYSWFAGIAAIATFSGMALTSLAALVFFRRHPEISIGRWKGVMAPVLGTLALVAMVILGAKNLPTLMGGSATIAYSMLAALVVIFLTGVVTASMLRKRNPAVYQRIGRQGSTDVEKESLGIDIDNVDRPEQPQPQQL
jgi:amino acid transporter